MTIHHLSILAVLAISIVSCGGSQPSASTPPTTEASDRLSSLGAMDPRPDDNATRGKIRVADDVRKACGLSDDAAYFAFDSARVQDKDRELLRALAVCFESGPLKGRQMSLVGHADPRGSEDYNLALGGRRADNVKTLIVAENMNVARISTTSRGEMDATGSDEPSWANDRTVDVKLAN